MGVIFKNNVMYGAGDIEISPICYSDEEREVGCWVDGKPLYQTTIHTGALTKDGNWHNVAHNISNIDKIILCTGVVYTADGEAFLMPNYRPTYSMGICLGATNTDIEYIQNWLDTSPDSYVTLQYTKTTDSPGSGIWTPSGVPAVHYSTDEHVVGTWIDGSTVYEKTVEITSIPNSNMTDTAHEISNMGIIISAVSTVHTLASVDSNNTFTSIPRVQDNSANSENLAFEINKTNVRLKGRGRNFSTLFDKVIITIRYTKTTS